MNEKLLDALQAEYFNTDRRGAWKCVYHSDNSGDYETRDYKIVEETKFGPSTIIDGILNPADGMFIAFVHNNMPEILSVLLEKRAGDKHDE